MEPHSPGNTDALGETASDEHIGLLAVDVRGFSKHNETQQQKIVDVLTKLLQQALNRINLGDLWRSNEFRAYRGDGFLIGFPCDRLPNLVDSFFDALQSELRYAAPELRSHGITLRVRAGLHLGPAPSFDSTTTDSPAGPTVVDVNRMVNADATRALLENSAEDVTFVAAVLSPAVLQYAVASGRTTRRRAEFAEVTLQMNDKDYVDVGYLRVPCPSGRLLESGLLYVGRNSPDGSEEPPIQSIVAEGPEPAQESATNTITGNAEKIFQTRDVSGGLDDHSTHIAGSGVSVIGDHNNTAGGSIDHSVTNQEFSGHFHTGQDANFGPRSGGDYEHRG